MSAVLNPNKRGSQGEAGATGATGNVGPQGNQGEPGLVGVTGDQGPQGDVGPKGDQGEVGPQGPSGISKRIEVHTGTSNASGIYAVTFGTPFPSTPHIAPAFIGATTEQSVRIVSVSASGFSVHAFQRGGLSVLGLTLLALATTNVSGAAVSVLVTEA